MKTKKEIMVRLLQFNREEDHQLLRKQKRLARQETIVTSLEENRTNPKRFWRCLDKNFALGKQSNAIGCVRQKALRKILK